MKDANIVPIETITQKIFIIRGVKVMLDSDLAELYQVTTKRLNEQVKRNRSRFPEDFMFQLTESERNEVVANCDHLRSLKFSYQFPYAFTEHGVAMLSAVLKSQRAIEVSVFIVRAFVRLRELLSSNKELANELEKIVQEQKMQNKHINAIYRILDKLIAEPPKPKGKIGFGK